ncbi:MAG: hypothetical protein IPM45_13810 [Acidimicrobiales bacterium]|nr:hypothetical protein [Acidimicrobiales bacterium]
MHPIERLRYVARASGTDHALLVRETAGALAALGFDPPGIVTACRRIIERHPTSGPLWWLACRVLVADDPVAEAWRAADDLADDPTAFELAHALPDDATVLVLGWPEQIGEALPRRGDVQVLAVDVLDEGVGLVRRLRRSDVEAVEVPVSGLGVAAARTDLVLLEASALGPGGLVGIAGSRAAAAVARHAGTPVWAVAGVGRVLPGRLWEALVERLDADDPWEADDELVPLDLVDRVAGPRGVDDVAAALAGADCPVAPELLRQVNL